MLWMAIASCGALGAVARYLVSSLAYQWLGRGFPWGTLVVNGSGSLLIGFLVGYWSYRHSLPEPWRTALITGGLGAFTTFSTFSLEAVQLIQQQMLLKALAYMLVSLVLCASLTALGLWLGYRS